METTPEFFDKDQALIEQRKVVMKSALYGFLIGLTAVAGAWYVELLHEELSIRSIDSIIQIHQRNGSLWIIDLIPVVLAWMFGRLGYTQGRLKVSNQILEDRVRERTMEITLEKARTNAIFDNAADSIIAFDSNGAISLYNNAAQGLFGYRYSEAIGRDIRSLIPVFEQVTDGQFLEFARAHEKNSAPGSTSVKFQGLTKDGTLVPVDVDISQFSLGDEVSFTTIIRDLSERKRAERLEKSLLQVSQVMNQSQELDQLYMSIHESMGQVVDVTNFTISMIDDEQYRVVFAVSDDEEVPEFQQPVPLEGTLHGLIVKTGQSLLVDEAKMRELIEEGQIKEKFRRLNVCWLGVPLISNGECIGVMAVGSYEEGVYFTQKDAWVMNVVSGQIANAIEREHAREQLRQSEKRYRRMVEEAGDIVYTSDLGGRFTYTNPPISKLTGYQESELINQHSSMLVAEDWKGQVRQFYRRQLRDKMKESTFEFQITTKGGKRRWIEQNTTLLFDGDRPVGFQAIVHDITERREAEAALREREERFRSLSASSPIGIFQVNSKGLCVYTNKRWHEITGRPLEQSLGSGWIDAIHPDDRQTFKIEWMFSRDEGSTGGREFRILTGQSEVRWVNIRWTPTQNDYQELTGYVGTFEDITLRKKSEQMNRVLYEISQAAQTTDDLQEFFKSIHRSLGSILDTTNFYVATYDGAKGTVRFPYAREADTDLNLSERPVGKGLTGYVIRTGRALLADEEHLNRLYAGGEVTAMGKPTRNWLGVPLFNREGVVGVVILQSYTNSNFYSEADLQTIIFVSSQIASAIQRKSADEERRRYTVQLAEAHNRIKEDLKLAARIQQARLPQHAPPVSGVEFSWLFHSCDEVAGDMFNFVQLNDHKIGIYILDVSGHGVPAALLSISLSRSMSAASDGSGALLKSENGKIQIVEPAEVAEIMNRRFPMNLEINQYFTFLYGILDLNEMTFTFSRAGHPAPVFIHRSQAELVEEALGPAIGIIPEMKFTQHMLKLEEGDEFLLYTDGIDEAANSMGEEFGVERILETLSSPRSSVEEDVKALREAVRDFTSGGPQMDDITIVAFRMTSRSKTAKASPI